MKDKKKIILISLIIIGVIFIVVGIILFFKFNEPVVDKPNDQQQEQPPKEDKNENVIYSSPDKKENKDIEISNLSYEKLDAGYMFSFDIVNNSKVNYDNLIANLLLYKGDREFLYGMELHLGKIKSGESKKIERVVYVYFPEVTDYDFVVSK